MKRRNFLKNLAIMTSASYLLGNTIQAKSQPTKNKPIIVIHGGTSGLGLTQDEFSKRQKAMLESLQAGQKILANGGSAIDAVIAAIKVMEDNPLFNAGKGAVFTSDGFNELDAAIMDGNTKKAGAIAMSRAIKNPIEAARLVMDKTWHTLIAGEGADKLAKDNGLEMVNQKYYFTQERYDQLQEAKRKEKLMLDSDKHSFAPTHFGNYTEPYLGTVGAVAFDSKGNLAAGTSTGGLTNKMTGRIGDSPIIGAGTYANNDSLGLSCTGTGDIFMRVVSGHEAAALYKYKKLSLQKSIDEMIKEVARLGGEGGIVSIDRYGNPAYAWTKDKLGMFHGQARIGEDAKVFFPVAKK